MTKKDFEIKLAGAKTNKVLPEKQREQIIALYTRKIAEFEAAEKKTAPAKTSTNNGLVWKQNGSGLWAYFKGNKQMSDGFPENVEGYRDLAKMTMNSESKKAPQSEPKKVKNYDIEKNEGKTKDKPKFKVGDVLKFTHSGKPYKVILKAKDTVSFDEEDYKYYYSFDRKNEINIAFNKIPESAITKTKDAPAPDLKDEPEAKSKKTDSDDYCKELIEKAEKAHAAAKKRAAAPKKTEVTKSKEKIEKVHDTVQKNVEAGKFGKAQLQKLITETEELLTFLKKTLKSL